MARKKGAGGQGAASAPAGSAAAGADDVKREQKLQALLLADAFMRTFRPITFEKPKVLLPLVNVTMLEYTIEFLALNGVQEIFVVSSRHPDAVKEFISTCRWPNTLTVHAVATPSCLTAGDALREVDALGLIQSDPFVLVSGDVVSNMNLAAAIEFHKRCKKADSNTIMTTVLQPLVKTARIRPVMDDLTVAIDGNTGQVLMYDNKFTNEEVSIPLELYKEHRNVVFMDQMMDCQIDICSPEALVKFSDNFDYQDMRRDMIVNEVTNYELGGHIYSWTLRGEYAARVHDPRTYHAVCEDIIRRWLFPIVPESNFSFSQRTNYIHTKRYIYKDDATTSRSAVVGRGSVLGAGTTLGEHCKVAYSTIGKNCTLGAGVVVRNSHIWDNVVIEDGAVLDNCIVCEGVRIKRGATVSTGCVISFNVVIGEGVTIPSHSRVSMFPTDDEDDFKQLSGQPFDADLVGADGKGYRWQGETGADFDYVAEPEDAELLGLNMDRARLAGCTQDMQWKSQLWATVPEPQEDEASSIEFDEDEALRLFIRTIKEQMLTAHADGSSTENVLMEIKGYKFAQNREFADCLQGVITALLELADFSQADLKFVGSFQQVLQKWKPVVTSLTMQPEEEQAIIEAVEQFWLEPEPKQSKFALFRIILQVLYKLDIVSHDALVDWAEARRELGDDTEDANLKALFNHPSTQELVAWLEEEDDDDEDDDEEDDDEED